MDKLYFCVGDIYKSLIDTNLIYGPLNKRLMLSNEVMNTGQSYSCYQGITYLTKDPIFSLFIVSKVIWK